MTARLAVGDRVRIPDGRSGTLRATYRSHGRCGWAMVLVQLDNGHDWAGRRSEVRPA